MKGLIGLVVLSAVFCHSQSSSPIRDVEIRLNADVFYVSMLQPAHVGSIATDSLVEQHQDYWNALSSAGSLVLEGPVSGSELDRIVVYQADNDSKAIEIAKKDPLVREKQSVTRIGRWLTDSQQISKLTGTSYFIGFVQSNPKAHQSYEDSVKARDDVNAYLNKLINDGVLVAFGGLWKPVESREQRSVPCGRQSKYSQINCRSTGSRNTRAEGWGSVLLFRAATLSEAQQLVNEEPIVRQGTARTEIYQWKLSQ